MEQGKIAFTAEQANKCHLLSKDSQYDDKDIIYEMLNCYNML